MGTGSHLVIYGNTMFLAGIRAELERLTSLRIVAIENGCPEAVDLVAANDPLVVLFDLAASPQGFSIALLRRCSNLLLIGVDPSSNKMLVLSCQPAEALSMSDLVDVINQEVLGSQAGEGCVR